MVTIKGHYRASKVEQVLADARESIGVSRIAVFLGYDECLHDCQPFQNRLLCGGAIGIPAEVHQNQKLSYKTGIGKWVTQHGQILRRQDAGWILNPAEIQDVQKEFDSMNCDIAIPITDQKHIIGVALLGPPLSRSNFGDEDLRIIFHIMEQFGLFIQSYRAQRQLSRDNKILNQMLSMLQCGALAVTPDLTILKANSAIKDFLGLGQNMPLGFEDMPPQLRTQIRGAMEQLKIPAPFFLSLPTDPKKRLLRVMLQPLSEEAENDFHGLIVTVEDFSEVESAKEAATATATSRIANQLQLLTS